MLNNDKFSVFQKTFLHALCLLFISQDIFAQTPAEGTAKDIHELTTMTVTAQKREENIQRVPASMDVFSGMELEEAGIVDLKELSFFSPNLYVKQQTNQNMLIIRGISSHNVVLNTPAGLFVDDINYPMTFMQNPDLLDVERVEVLRGPQGTLYGRNTESGAVKIITRQPGNELYAKVFGEVGIYDTPDDEPLFFRAGASASGPISRDHLFLGLAVQTEDSDGYTVNDLYGDDEAGKIQHRTAQGKLRWTPGDSWDIQLLANVFENDDGYGYIHYIDGPDRSERYHLRWDGNNSWTDENNGQALKVQYRGALFDVIAITTRNDFETNFVNDGEFGSFPYGDQVFMFGNESLSQEIRFSSPKESSAAWQWLIGGYAFTDENEALAEFFGQSRTTDFDSDGIAVFGQVTRRFYERLRLTGGLRLDHQSSEGSQSNNQVAGPYSNDLDHTEWLPKVSLDYDLTDAIMSYATVSKGILAGGYNYAFASDSDSLIFEPEKTWNYEIGLKSSWLDERMICNLALYYIDISDKQVEEYISGPSVRSISNAAQAWSRGAEMDVNVRLMRGLRVFGAAGYSEARIDEWLSHEIDGTRFDYHNKRLPFAPTYTYNLGLDYLSPGDTKTQSALASL